MNLAPIRLSPILRQINQNSSQDATAIPYERRILFYQGFQLELKLFFLNIAVSPNLSLVA